MATDTVAVLLRLPKALLAKLDKLAKAEGRPRTNYLRYVLAKAAEEQKK